MSDYNNGDGMMMLQLQANHLQQAPSPARQFSTLGGGNGLRRNTNAVMMPNPDSILPRAAWTDYSGGTMDEKWSEELTMAVKNGGHSGATNGHPTDDEKQQEQYCQLLA